MPVDHEAFGVLDVVVDQHHVAACSIKQAGGYAGR